MPAVCDRVFRYLSMTDIRFAYLIILPVVCLMMANNERGVDGHQCQTPNLTVLDVLSGDKWSDGYIEVAVGSQLRLMCQSEEPFHWYLPHPDYEEIPDHAYVSYSYDNNTWYGYLTIDALDWPNVGPYSCHYNSTKSWTETKHNSIYVFLTGSNISQLIVTDMNANMHSIQIWRVRNKKAIIPCRPTSREVNITLWVINKDNSSTQLRIGAEYGIAFDAKIGFTIERLSSDNISCRAQHYQREANITIHVVFTGSFRYAPEIDANSAKYVFVGHNFTLNCRVRIDFESTLELEWQSNNVCDEKNNVLIENTWTQEENGIKWLNRNITVLNVNPTDEDYYVCAVIDFSLNRNETKHFVKVYESAQLNLKLVDHNLVKPSCFEAFHINVLIDAVPNDIDALSLNLTKDGETIADGKTYLTPHNGSLLFKYRIDTMTAFHSGLYELYVSVLNIKFTNVSIKVNGEDCVYRMVRQKAVPISEDKDKIVYITVFAIFGTVLLSMSVFLGRQIREERRQKRELEYLSYSLFESGQMEMINPDIPLDEQIDLLPYDNRWEFERQNLKLGQILGQGAFGRVVKAEAYGLEDLNRLSELSTTVAVKMLKEKADLSQRKALLAELKILIHVGRHLNIVNLVGAVTKDLIKGELLVIVEYCRFGNIRSYLLGNRRWFVDQLYNDGNEIDETLTELSIKDHKYVNDSVVVNGNKTEAEYQNMLDIKETNAVRKRWITTSDLINYIFQCCKGMQYLSSKKLIHRDLAARNVLLADNDVVKICDFGLARDCYNYDNYVKKGEGPLPIKWMAIESMRDKVFTTKSDVWSFGVFAWEIFTLGASPYPGFELDEDFYKRLLDGYRMERPEFAPNKIYSLMQTCWEYEPSDRPDFTTLSEQLATMMSDIAIKHYECQLEQYKTKGADQAIEYMRMTSEIESVDAYVDMTTSGSAKVFDWTAEKCSAIVYDNIKNVRPVDGSHSTHGQPMECVPMIQL